MDFFSGKRPDCAYAVLVYLENLKRGAGSGAGFWKCSAYYTLWLDGNAVCCLIHAGLHCGADVFALGGISYCYQCPYYADTPYLHAFTGKIDQFGTGKLRRIILETSGSAETYLAHQLPDKAKAFATIVGLLALLLVFDWRLGLLSLIPVVLGFATMTRMTGKGMQQKMTEYQNALSDMSGEAVEYPEGCRGG